jgi:tRNA(Ile)-lysidine synthetase-like protein
MLEKFQIHLQNNFPFLKGKKLLLATSGGIDSMAMVHLFQQTSNPIAIAHCNFQLRGLESFEDQKFIEDYAAAHHIPIYSTKFDTNAFADDYQLSIQMAARELRYNWFYELLETENYDFILTAHHADDNLETFIINLSRGTGLEGLSGIPVQNNKIIRPFLLFSRYEIEVYVAENNIVWREDSSNASNKYLRNKIRHDLIPVLKELNPNFSASFQKTQHYLQEAQQMVEDASVLIYQQVAKEIENDIHFELKKLIQLPNFHSYLFQWLKEFGFSDWDVISDLVESQSGKQVFSKQYRLLKNRDTLILSPIEEINMDEFWVEEKQKIVKFPLNLSFCKATDISASSNSSIFVDENKLKYPLQIRKWKKGDVFQPFGMNGSSKKVSKFFKDEKLSLIEKEKIWLLCSDNQIVWIIGLRTDERYKIEPTTTQILNITTH